MWVIRNKVTGEFFHKDSRYDYTRNIKNAKLMNSRSCARKCKQQDESVYKVSVGTNGVQIIGPEWA